MLSRNESFWVEKRKGGIVYRGNEDDGWKEDASRCAGKRKLKVIAFLGELSGIRGPTIIVGPFRLKVMAARTASRNMYNSAQCTPVAEYRLKASERHRIVSTDSAYRDGNCNHCRENVR